MKLSTQDAFEKNIRQSAPDNFSKIYAAIIGDRFERLFFAEKVYAFLKHYKPGMSREWIRIENGDPVTFPGDLFAMDERFIIIDHVEKVKKSEYKAFVEAVENVDEKTTILLLGDTLSNDIYQALKSDIVTIDLTKEKPWEKKSRLIREMAKMAAREKKLIDMAALDLLVDSVGNDLSRLKSEIEKLFVFTEGKKGIEVSDVRQMTMPTKEKSYWQMARDLILGLPVEKGRIKDLSDWLIFAGQVRSQLLSMVKISECLERGETPKVEGMRDKDLALLTQKCKERTLTDLLDLLNMLFQFELEAKEEGARPAHLVDMLSIAFAKQLVTS